MTEAEVRQLPTTKLLALLLNEGYASQVAGALNEDQLLKFFEVVGDEIDRRIPVPA